MDKINIFVSVITSLIASVVFWLISVFSPTLFKYLHVRPRVEENLADIKLQLFFFIQMPFYSA